MSLSPREQFIAATSKAKLPKRAKYGNRRTEVNGAKFDSVKEGRRWLDLLVLQRAGKIGELQRQVWIPLTVNGVVCAHYVADFEYLDNEKGQLVWEDVKSAATRKLPLFVLKAKMVKAIYGREVLLT